MNIKSTSQQFELLCSQYMEHDVYAEGILQFVEDNYVEAEQQLPKKPRRKRWASMHSDDGGGRSRATSTESRGRGDEPPRRRWASMRSDDSRSRQGSQPRSDYSSPSRRPSTTVVENPATEKKQKSSPAKEKSSASSPSPGKTSAAEESRSAGVLSTTTRTEQLKEDREEVEKAEKGEVLPAAEEEVLPVEAAEEKKEVKLAKLLVPTHLLDNKQEPKDIRHLKKKLRDIIRIEHELKTPGQAVDRLRAKKAQNKATLMAELEKKLGPLPLEGTTTGAAVQGGRRREGAAAEKKSSMTSDAKPFFMPVM